MLRRLIDLATAVALVVLVGCADQDPTTPPPPGHPPQMSMLDGTVQGENSLFHWMSPIGTVDESTLDPLRTGLDPIILLCDISANYADGTPIPDEFCSTDAHAMQSMATSVVDGHYESIIHVDEVGMKADNSYRLTVLLNGYKMGHADLYVADNAKGFKNLDTGEYVGVTANRSLPAKFHLADVPGFCTNGDLTECFRGTVTPEGGSFRVPSRHAGVVFPANAVDEPVTLLIERVRVDASNPCLPTDFEQYEGCYEYDILEEGKDQFNTDVTVAQCLDQNVSEAQEDLLQYFKYDHDEPDASLVKLTGTTVAVDFLSCDDFVTADQPQAAGEATWMNRLAGLGARVLDPILGRILPQALHATDLGLAGLTDSFTTIGWAEEYALVAQYGAGQLQALDEPAYRTMDFRVLTAHPSLDVETGQIAGVPVTLTYTDPSGVVLDQQSMTTDANGAVSYQPTIGATVGEYTVTVTPDESFVAPASMTIQGVDGTGTINVYAQAYINGTATPVEGAVVSVPGMASTFTTGSDGTVTIADAPAGTYDIAATHDTYTFTDRKAVVDTSGSASITFTSPWN